ncbi:MAG: PCYCGC motif-containing (lipo)protein [Actinomycetota bacterium]
MRRRVLAGLMAAIALSGFAAAGCSKSSRTETRREETPAVSLPEFAYRTKLSILGYTFAATREGRLMAYIPCYCGCGQKRELYRNLKDCFLHADGTWSAHAANCEICLDEAKDVKKMLEDGVAPAEIRDRIDAKYGGRGTPTDTSPIPADFAV